MIERATLIANGDLRLAANQKAWATQSDVEKTVTVLLERAGVRVTRGHPYQTEKEHGFIDSQHYGMEVFRRLDRSSALVVVLSTWQYSHHILHGLQTHQGPILTIANFSGAWPGLVGMLNLNASLRKTGVEYSTLWSSTFDDPWFLGNLDRWIETGAIRHDDSHVRSLTDEEFDSPAYRSGHGIGAGIREAKSIIGVFDEGCMGMYNAIIPDALLNMTGIFKERLSQSALYHETQSISDTEAQKCRDFLDARGLRFFTGPNPETDLTDSQILTQLKLYIAATRIADDFGCEAIGIQYQQGLKDLLPASDLAEGLLNSTDRPDVKSRSGRETLYAGQPLPHFNEVDECAGVDGLVTARVWRALGMDPENTLHDVRWGDEWQGKFVWVFEISGAAPVEHLAGGYAGASSMRQPPMYFRLGGGTLRGVCKEGHIVWSRVFVENNALHADLGTGRVLKLPNDETERRWRATNYEWPIMHAVLDGVDRNQMMARHPSNHVQVAYATDAAAARNAMLAKAGAFGAMGIESHVCGVAPVSYHLPGHRGRKM